MLIFRTAFAEFPSLSVCPSYFKAFKKDVLHKHNTSASEVRKLQFPNTEHKSLDFYEMVTLDLTELLQSVELNFHENFPNTKTKKLIFLDKNDMMENPKAKIEYLDKNHWVQHNWLTLGRCYTYSIPQNLRELSVRSVTFTTNFDLLVYIHHPGQFWWVDTDTKLPVHTREKSFVDVRHSVVHAMPKIVEINHTDFLSCSEQMDFGYDNCYLKDFDEQFYEKFKCLHPLMAHRNATKPICDIGKFSAIEKQNFADLHDGKQNNKIGERLSLMYYIGFFRFI